MRGYTRVKMDKQCRVRGVNAGASCCLRGLPLRIQGGWCLLVVMVAMAIPLLHCNLCAQVRPLVRPLGPVVRVSPPGVLGSVSAVRALPEGNLIVHDLARRQVLLLDSNLRKVRTIADTTAMTGMAYGARLCGLMAFAGDSTLFIDPASNSMAIIDPEGNVARVIAVPSVEDANLLVGGPFGTPGVDPRGNIIYRGYGRAKGLPLRVSEQAAPELASKPDSAPLFRVALATRERHVVGQVAIPMQSASSSFDATGRITGTVLYVTPLPIVDAWALLPDGRIAVVRGADYHVDWLMLDGQWSSTPKIPFNWRRLDDVERERVLDSVRTEFGRERDRLDQLGRRLSGDSRALMSAGSESALAAGTVFTLTRPGVTSGASRMQLTIPVVRLVSAAELPDYYPAFKTGALRVDAEGRLWVLTTEPSRLGPIYDVIDGKGELVDRVRLPFGRVIAGFARGVVFMGVLDDAGARLEIAKIK